MEAVHRTMMSVLRGEITGKKLETGDFSARTDEEWKNLFFLSKSHDLAHLVGDYILKHNLIPESEIKNQFLQQSMMAVHRFQLLEYDLAELKRVLNEAKIPYLPLKGAILRKYYPQPWMRTSCDIDVLVHEEDLEKAKEVLEQRLKYRFDAKSSHDIGGYSQSQMHFELHYTLIENDVVSKAEKPLQKVWEYASPVGESSFYKMTDAMFYYYHIAHMAKHFENGGCGIRPFLDLYVLRTTNRLGDEAERNALLKEGGLTKFAEVAEKLSRVWMEEETPDELTLQLENYLLTGGVYGSTQNRVSVQQVNKGSKLRYAWSRIWLPYEVLRFHYPSLEKHRWLLPIYEIRRWFKLAFCGGFKRSVRELSINAKTTENQAKDVKFMLEELELL